MKPIVLLVILFSLVTSCTERHVGPQFEFKEYAGIWVPYEIIYEDGTNETGPFSARTIFGVYAESIQLKVDKTYTPVIWYSKDQYSSKMEDAGVFEFSTGRMSFLLHREHGR
jgi:hypothetical protein